MSHGTVDFVTCPACGKVGSSKRPIRIGAKVRCKGCGQGFEAGDDSETYEPDLPQAVPPATSPSAPINLNPTTRRKAKKKAGREPHYFTTLIIIGWMTIGGGVSQLAWSIFRLVAFRIGPTPPPDDFRRSAHESTDAFLVTMLEVSSGIAVSSVMLGCLLWLAVDVARSLRRAA